MPLYGGDVRVSTMPVPSSSSSLRRLSVKGTSCGYPSPSTRYTPRATSLDRVAGRDACSSRLTSFTSCRFAAGGGSTSSSSGSYAYSARSRALLPSSSSHSLDIRDTDLNRRTTTRSRFDVSLPKAYSFNRYPSSSRSSGVLSSYRSSTDAINDLTTPVLIRYRDLGDTSTISSYGRRSSLSRQSSFHELSSGSSGHLADTSSTVLTSGSTSTLRASHRSSSPSSINHDTSTHRLLGSSASYNCDANHNLYSTSRDRDNDSGYGSRFSTLSSSSSRHWRSLGSSSSSVDSHSGSSSSDCSPSPQRSRKGSSSLSEESSSNGSTSVPRLSRDKSEKQGLVGLRNLGNTCFMNSVLQCLSHTRPLLEYCLRDSYTLDINTTISCMKGALFKAFASLLQSMWRASIGETAVSPHAFKSQIQRFAPRFMGYTQQDAQEFLRYLLQGLHEDVNRVVSKPRPLTVDIDDNLSESQKAMESWKRYLRYDDSKIVDIFVGQLKSTLQCTVCGHSSVTFDPFWDLSLPIPKGGSHVTLQQCLNLFTKEEILDGDEKPTCSKCKTRRKCTKSFSIYKFPKILVLHLKRFSPSERFRGKLNCTVDFPLDGLDLGSYASGGMKGHCAVYNLYAVSNHTGSTYSGHYTAVCRHPYTGEWHDFNDAKVTHVGSSSVVSAEAYVLFYELASQSSHL